MIYMEFKFSKHLYPKLVLLKSAYSFTDRAYLHLDQDEKHYIVQIEFKNDNKFDLQEFENEMLTQAVRYEILTQTKDIRRLLLARAFASTVIEDDTIPLENDKDDFDVNNILKDWVEHDGT